MSNTNINSVGARLVGVDDPTRDDHAATKGYVDAHGGGGSVSVTDGTHTVSGLTELDFTSGATVTDAGGGVAQVAVAGGGSQPGILQAKAEFTSADLLAGELIILPAQGANTIIVPTVVLGVYRFVTTPYANTGGSLYVGPNYNAADVYGGWNSVIAGSADRVSAIDFFTNYLDGTGNVLTNLINQPMGYSLNPPTDGDGTLTIFACYTLLDIS